MIAIDMDSATQTILVIDDEAIIRESMAAYLEDSGFTVLQAADGREGLDRFRRRHPDLVLVDLRMPEVDGLEVLAAIQAESPETPTLVVSGTGVLSDAIEALRHGAQDFLTKPILDMAVLEHAVANALEQARLRRENRRYRQHLESEIEKRTADLRARSLALQAANTRLSAEMAQREQTARELTASQARLKAILELFEGFIYTCSADQRIEYMNRKLRKHIGRNALGESCHKVLAGSDRPCAWCVQDQVLKGETARWEARNPRDGRWYYGITSPIYDGQGRVSKLQTIAIDISDRKRAEEALQERETQVRQENMRLRSSLKGKGHFGALIGKSAPMQKVYDTILKAAQSPAGVIVYGESGTGKELVARTIHDLSRRAQGPFVPVNCGAIPENLIESEFFGHKKGAFSGAQSDKPGVLDLARGGTLFLDEVGEIPLSLQVKLLRAIEGGGYTPVGGSAQIPTDFRIIAATHQDLGQLVAQGAMRSDFYYRIQVIPIHLPPLKARPGDLPDLIHHFLAQLSRGDTLETLPAQVMAALGRYHWPGNVRELANVIQRYVTLKEIDLDLPPAPTPRPATVDVPQAGWPQGDFPPLTAFLNQAEKTYLKRCLESHQWKRGRVAEILGIDRRTLFRKMKAHGLS
ncbi:MAG: sigma 54-interacting transcriptional regulator [Desulfobacterales bacterium]